MVRKYLDRIFVTLITLLLIVCTAFFTIFKLKFSDYLQLVPQHTDAVTMASFVSLFSTLVTVACFNYMVMADQLETDAKYHTSFLNFYSGMLRTPFLGDKLQHILPSCIILFAIMFLVISVRGYTKKAAQIFRTGKLHSNSSEAIQTTLEKIYKGELAILKDI